MKHEPVKSAGQNKPINTKPLKPFAAKKPAAIVPRVDEVLIEAMGKSVTNLFSQIAEKLSLDLAPPVLAAAMSSLKVWQEDLKALHDNVRTRVLDLLVDHGEVVTEKGTLILDVDGWKLEARPQKTGFDSKKVEALLRAKSLSVATLMDTVVTYKCNDEKLAEAVGRGELTKDELETCKYELSYAVQSPKRTGEEG